MDLRPAYQFNAICTVTMVLRRMEMAARSASVLNLAYPTVLSSRAPSSAKMVSEMTNAVARLANVQHLNVRQLISVHFQSLCVP